MSERESPLAGPVRRLVESGPFNAFIIGVIVFNAFLIGKSTYVADEGVLAWIATLEAICIGIFVVEIALRFVARTTTRAFFRDGWNVFDLAIVITALLPATNGLGPLLRILRVFRVLRLVKAIPELRLIVNVLVRSVASMKYVALLAAVLFYVYAVIGVKLFGDAAHPLHIYFSSIHETCFTLFRILTGDEWSRMRYELGAGGHSVLALSLYQVSWIVIATFLLVNLIVGAVINNYQKVQDIEERRTAKPLELEDQRLRDLVREIDAILAARASRNGEESEASQSIRAVEAAG